MSARDRIYATALRVRDMTLLQDAMARRLGGQASPGANEVIDLSGAGSMAPPLAQDSFSQERRDRSA